MHYRSSVAFRARQYFSIPWTQRVNTESIRKGVLRIVPIGIASDQIDARLRSVGIGTDELSGYYIDPHDGDGVIRLEYDPRHLTLVQTHYGIMLHFESGFLKSVRVEHWLTGP